MPYDHHSDSKNNCFTKSKSGAMGIGPGRGPGCKGIKQAALGLLEDNGAVLGRRGAGHDIFALGQAARGIAVLDSERVTTLFRWEKVTGDFPK